MRKLWRKATTSLALVASAAWAQETIGPEELVARQRAAMGLLFTMLGGLVLVFVLMWLMSRRDRLRAEQQAKQEEP